MARSRHQPRNKKDPATQEEKKAKRDAKKDQRRARKDQEHGGEQYKKNWKEGDGRPGSYALAPKENQAYEQYYKGSGLIPENEWDQFMSKMRQPLPATFRVTGFKKESRELLRIIKADFLSKLTDGQIDGQPIEPPKCLEWYPDGLAWQINLDRKIIRTHDTLKSLHQFLIQEMESGNISRQEAVSMIPPLVLDVKPHHKVLDMCAAPGSKTSQLIECLHADDSKAIPDGVVVANDSDNRRCYLMVHNVKRMESPSFVVINHDATMLPNLSLSPPDAERHEKKILKFDRVLADVPCSGDGTLRKNPDAWYKWNPIGACHLHNLQARILRRGLEMLAVGGRLVYSTCSLNPIEDEAVVANLLTQAKGTVETVDVTGKVPGLLYEKGVSEWKLMSRDGEWYSTFEEVPQKLHTQMRPNLFQPTPELAQTMHLDRCMRILPHKQDTGGFFVAVLEKREEVPWVLPAVKTTAPKEDSTVAEASTTEEATAAAATATDTTAAEGEAAEGSAAEGTKRDAAEAGLEEAEGEEEKKEEQGQRSQRGPPKKKFRKFGYKEDPFIFFDASDPIWPPISEFFGITEFPVDQVMVRSYEGKRRNLYFTSKLVKDIISFNQDRLKFINLGLKVMSRSESHYVTCDFRPVQDGIGTLYPFMSRRIVHILKEDIVTILSSDNPYCSKLTKHAQGQMHDLDQGGCVFLYTPDDRPDSPQCDLVITGWKGKVSCRSFLCKNDRGHFLRLCGVSLRTKEEILADKAAAKAEKASTSESKGENGGEGPSEDTEVDKKEGGVEGHSEETEGHSEEDAKTADCSTADSNDGDVKEMDVADSSNADDEDQEVKEMDGAT